MTTLILAHNYLNLIHMAILASFVANLQHLVNLPHFAEYIQQCDGRLDINNQTWAEFVWLPLKLQDVKGKLLKTIAHELIVVNNSHGYDDPFHSKPIKT